MTLEELSWYVDNNVAKSLLSVSGMEEVYRRGGVSREIRVILDTARLQAHGLTASEVNAQLRQVNLIADGGSTNLAGTEQSVRSVPNTARTHYLGEPRIQAAIGPT